MDLTIWSVNTQQDVKRIPPDRLKGPTRSASSTLTDAMMGRYSSLRPLLTDGRHWRALNFPGARSASSYSKAGGAPEGGGVGTEKHASWPALGLGESARRDKRVYVFFSKGGNDWLSGWPPSVAAAGDRPRPHGDPLFQLKSSLPLDAVSCACSIGEISFDPRYATTASVVRSWVFYERVRKSQRAGLFDAGRSARPPGDPLVAGCRPL